MAKSRVLACEQEGDIFQVDVILSGVNLADNSKLKQDPLINLFL